MKASVLPEIEVDLCDGCGRCVEACPEGALALVDGKAALAKPWLCAHDGGCEIVCSPGAIAVPFAIVFGDASG